MPVNASAGIPLLSVDNIFKSFGQNNVLKGVTLNLYGGETIALIGGNGAGKSTLMKIIMGIHQADSGTVSLSGKVVSANKTAQILSSGIYMVPQEPCIFPHMTVEENIIIGFNEKRSVLHERLLELLDLTSWYLDLTRSASTLSIAEQSLVEILRGLLRDANVIIFDEPTSALTIDETKVLFRIIETLKAQKRGIIYITHRLNEVFQIATNVAIMRDGVITIESEVSNFNQEMLLKGLLPETPSGDTKTSGQEETSFRRRDGKPVMELRGYSGYGFSGINLDIYRGEILGIAGIVGAGRTELASTIFGKDKVLSGTCTLDGVDITGCSTRQALNAGINYVPEDRHLNGLFKMTGVNANTTSALLNKEETGRFFLNRKSEYAITQEYMDGFRIKADSQNQAAGTLSGGNQQKIVIARSLSTKPKVVILDEPTRGIDAGARQDVYAIIEKLKKQGVAIILISSDMEEIIKLSDMVVTVYHGKINGHFDRSEITEDRLTAKIFGVSGIETGVDGK